MSKENQDITQLAWGSPELETETKTNDGTYFKLETGESARIQVLRDHKPQRYEKVWKDGEQPQVRFDVKVKVKLPSGEYGSELIWSCSRTTISQLNSYIEKTDKFQIIKKERGFDVVPLGLPAD